MITTAQQLEAQQLSFDTALQMFERARGIAHDDGLREHSVVAVAGIAEALVHLERPRAALTRADEAVRLARGLPDRLRAGAFHARARAHDALGEYDLAQRDLQSAHELEPSNPARWMLLAQVAVTEQRFDDAREAFVRALELGEHAGDLPVVAQAHWEIAQIDRARGHSAEARAGFERAEEVARRLGSVAEAAYAEFALGELDAEAGDIVRARERFADVRAVAELLPNPAGSSVAADVAPAAPDAAPPAPLQLPAPVDREPVLRLVFAPELGERVQLELWRGGEVRSATHVAAFHFALHPRTEGRLRWYVEEFLERPLDPAPAIAAEVEEELIRLGEALYRELFTEPETRPLTMALADAAGQLRIEVVADTLAADSLPWELLREPQSGIDLALRVRGLTRTTTRSWGRVDDPVRAAGPIRILLVICRPAGGRDVGFRSISAPLVRSLADRDSPIALQALRPPTFERLQQVLREAHDEGRPFDLVHFDGHGVFDVASRRSYLLFEDDIGDESRVTGDLLGAELRSSAVPMLVMHACRSALGHHEQAYGSVAREVLEAGVPGVVAMRFNVYVATAALFITELYRALASGTELATAVTHARAQLAGQPLRAVGHRAYDLRDWCVPALYESRPTRLPAGSDRRSVSAVRKDLLPPPPGHGFVGRDEVFIELERALVDAQHVSLQGFAGAGKTTTAVEFARWYAATGGAGCAGPLVAIGADATIEDVIDRIGTKLSPDWQAGEVDPRASLLELVGSLQPLMVWEDADHLRDAFDGLLEDLGSRGGRVILTSIRPEPCARVPMVRMPNMPLDEALQLASAICDDIAADVSAEWLSSVVQLTYGHPLTIEVVIGEAVRRAVSDERDVERLRAGLRHEDSEADRAWTKPLRAVLGLAEVDRDRALLAQFHGYVTVPGFAAVRGDLDDMERAEVVLADAAKEGLLTAVDRGVYAIHPALPAALRAHGTVPPAAKPFAAAMAVVGSVYVVAAERDGLRPPWDADEANFRAARRLATDNGWWELAAELVRVLHARYVRQRRGPEWRNEILDAAPHFVDPETGAARPGLEWASSDFSGYLASLAEADGDLARAERLRSTDLDHRRAAAAPALAQAQQWTDEDRDVVRRLATGLVNLGPVQSAMGDLGARDTLTEATNLAQALGDWQLESLARLNLGVMYMTVPDEPQFDLADEQFAAGFDLTISRDASAAGEFLTERGTVRYERALVTRQPPAARTELEQAAELMQRAMQLRPLDAVLNHQLGQVFRQLGLIDESRAHFERAIELREAADELLEAADTRLQLADALDEAGLRNEALGFAESALQQLAAAPVEREDLALAAERTVARLSLTVRG